MVDENGLFGAQIGVAEVIPFAYELDVFGNPTTQQLINMVSTMEEGISNFVIQELFATCATSAASLSQQKEVPPPTEKTEKVREHHHVSSGLFPATPTTTFQSEEDRHQSHPGGGGSFAAAASVEWDEGERRHNHNRNGQRSLQQTSRLTGLSSRPKDVVVNGKWNIEDGVMNPERKELTLKLSCSFLSPSSTMQWARARLSLFSSKRAADSLLPRKIGFVHYRSDQG